MKDALAVFHALKTEHSNALKAAHGLTIKVGEGLDASILKLMKDSWSTDDPAQLLNSNGLFFGIWIDAACVAKGIVRYNLHAKKLREIKGQNFAAREFARGFRAQGGEELKDWPNWSYPKGPITLFEGHVTFNMATLHREASTLMDRFAALTPFLDQLLDQDMQPR